MRCTIVTTDPVDLVRPVHDCMPLVLSREDRERWWDPAASSEELETITHRPDGEALETRAVFPGCGRPGQ